MGENSIAALLGGKDSILPGQGRNLPRYPVKSVEDLGAGVKYAPAVQLPYRFAVETEKLVPLSRGHVGSFEICAPS